MSYTEKELKEFIRNSVAEWWNEANRAAVSSARADSAPDPGHLIECPDCFKKTVQKLKSASTAVCSDCGQPLGTDPVVQKLDSCPWCGSKEKAKRIESR